jgi:hypothetical protein
MKSQHYCNANPQGPLQCTTFTSPQSSKMTLTFPFTPCFLICQWSVSYFLVIFSSGFQGKFRITTSLHFYFKILSFVEHTCDITCILQTENGFNQKYYIYLKTNVTPILWTLKFEVFLLFIQKWYLKSYENEKIDTNFICLNFMHKL